MGRRGGYRATDLKAHLAALFKLTPDEVADKLVFSKNITSVTA
jgi:hypothetical protein